MLQNLPVRITMWRNLCLQRRSQVQVRGDECEQESLLPPGTFRASEGKAGKHCKAIVQLGRAQGASYCYLPSLPQPNQTPTPAAQNDYIYLDGITHLH